MTGAFLVPKKVRRSARRTFLLMRLMPNSNLIGHPRLGRRFQTTEFLVVHQLCNRRIVAAERALRIAPNADFTELHAE